MANDPSDDPGLDDDHTDEFPALPGTVVHDAEDPRALAAEYLEDTGEHPIRYEGLAAAEPADVERLRNDLVARDAKIAALEADIATLSAGSAEIERHVTAKDLHIEELQQALTKLRESLAEHGAAEKLLTTKLADREAELNRARDELEDLRQATTERTSELERLQDTTHAGREETAGLREHVAHAAVSRDSDEPQTLRERIATLASYIASIASRHGWWKKIEPRTGRPFTSVADLQREIAEQSKWQQQAETLAERETKRAMALRADLIEQARLVETLRRELAAARAADTDPSGALTAGLRTELEAARAAAEQATTELAAAREALAAALAERDAGDTQQTAAETRTSSEQAGPQPLPGDAAAPPPPPPAFEVIGQLEAEVEHKRQQVSAQHAELRERDQRLAATEQRLSASRLDLSNARTEFEQVRADFARLERALIEKDRAIEARDARIATLQDEIDQRLAAMQKRNAMDGSLHGLEPKRSERLRRTESQPADRTNTPPTLVCLTGEAPKQVVLTKKAIVIGRGSHCDVQVLTHFVSREHARITVDGGSAIIEDLGSTNGVFVNSVRIDRGELRHGDLITVGETQFRFLESMAH